MDIHWFISYTIYSFILWAFCYMIMETSAINKNTKSNYKKMFLILYLTSYINILFFLTASKKKSIEIIKIAFEKK